MDAAAAADADTTTNKQSTKGINNRLEEISKIHDTIRKDNKRSFRLTYYMTHNFLLFSININFV